MYKVNEVLNQAKILILKEFQLEWRNKYSLYSILVYIASTLFITYLSFKDICSTSTWNALFFIILLFIAVNAVIKSFSGHSRSERLYLYTLVSPQSIILSKIVYHWITLSVYALISLVILNGLFPLTMKHPGWFIGILMLTTLGISALFTFISSLSGDSANQSVLVAILSFPLIIPLMLTVIALSIQAIEGVQSNFSTNLAILGALDVINLVFAYLLFPYLWTD